MLKIFLLDINIVSSIQKAWDVQPYALINYENIDDTDNYISKMWNTYAYA